VNKRADNLDDEDRRRTLATGLSTPCIVIRSYEFRYGLKGDEGADAYEDEKQYQDRDDHQYEIGSAHSGLTLFSLQVFGGTILYLSPIPGPGREQSGPPTEGGSGPDCEEDCVSDYMRSPVANHYLCSTTQAGVEGVLKHTTGWA
jgi:hypothetical protein